MWVVRYFIAIFLVLGFGCLIALGAMALDARIKTGSYVAAFVKALLVSLAAVWLIVIDVLLSLPFSLNTLFHGCFRDIFGIVLVFSSVSEWRKALLLYRQKRDEQLVQPPAKS